MESVIVMLIQLQAPAFISGMCPFPCYQRCGRQTYITCCHLQVG